MNASLSEFLITGLEKVSTQEDLEKFRMDLTRKYGLNKVISNTDILNSLPPTYREKYRNLLSRKPTRTISGVSVVAIMTSPFSCPHGRCTYCPGGVEFSSPQSYTGLEPAAMRGKQNNYDPYLQTRNRIDQLNRIGHPTDKIDLIVMGGTFTARSEEYQRNFVKGALDAMNNIESSSLEEAISINETSKNRCIGLTIETRPDWFFEKEIDLALSYGATKVELGVQTTFNDIHRITKRAHRTYDVIRSTALSKDSGFKILYHVMPGIGGVDFEGDTSAMRRLFSDEKLRPDMLKIYPALIVEGTKFYEDYRNGLFRSYESEEAVELIANYFRYIPNYVRVHRIQRDIPVYKIVQGVKRSDIHNLALARARELGIKINEIRYREIGRARELKGKVSLRVTTYFASGGTEKFLEFIDEEENIIAFLRLRFPGNNVFRQEIEGRSIIREIKTFGKEARLNESGEFQHQGYGKMLLKEAEGMSREEGYDGILVISGIGVREYFRKNGYERVGPYMGKILK